MTLKENQIFQVDAFTQNPFSGNPAAVCLLQKAPTDDKWMQKVAAEMNLSETAFLYPSSKGGFHLQWFTPNTEVNLCGHATLSSAHILWETKKVSPNETISFHSKSGLLCAKQNQGFIELDFPGFQGISGELSSGIAKALLVDPVQVSIIESKSVGERTYLVELKNENQVRAVTPNFSLLRDQGPLGVIVTAKADMKNADFVSRYFVPWVGIDEDPVTGSAHCCLAPYWSQKLGRNELMGYQASSRGGFVGVRVEGKRVTLKGKAVTILRGTLFT